MVLLTTQLSECGNVACFLSMGTVAWLLSQVTDRHGLVAIQLYCVTLGEFLIIIEPPFPSL